MNTDAAVRDLLEAAARKLEQDMRQIGRCAGLLSEQEFWSRANEHCNSVGVLVLHLAGNVRQWILGGVAGRAVERDRPAEFAARGPAPVGPAIEALKQTVRDAVAVIRGVRSAQAPEPRTIQGYRVSVLLAVFHVAEHFSFHTGQVVHMTKVLRDVDLSLYDAQGQQVSPDGWPWRA